MSYRSPTDLNDNSSLAKKGLVDVPAAPSSEPTIPLNFQVTKISDTRIHIKATFTPPTNNCKATGPRRVTILVLDISGSMGGSPLESGKKAYIALIRDLVTSGNPDIEFITYGTYSRVYHIDENNYESMIQTISNIGTSGVTNFVSPLEDIQKIAEDRYLKFARNIDFRVMFFTDGQANNRVEEIPQTLVNTSELLKKQFELSKVSTRALGRSSDTRVMSQLTNLGNLPGDHKYSSSPEEIMGMVAGDPDFTADARKVSLFITDKDGKESKYEDIPMIRADGDSKQYIASIFVDRHTKDDESITITGITSEHKIKSICMPQVPNKLDLYDLKLKSIENKHAKIAHEFVKLLLIQQFNDKLYTQIKELINEVIAFEAVILLMPKSERRKMLEKSTQLKHTLEEFHMQARAIRNSKDFDNAIISRLLEAAHFSNKRSLNRMILKREDEGRKKMKEDDAKLLANSEALTEKKEKELNKSGLRDNINLTGLGEVIREGSCLCFTGIVTRTEEAIANGALVNFRIIYSKDCIITFDLYTDMLTTKINKDGEYPEDVHNGWGFEFKGGPGVMKSAYRTPINFAYPIYGSPEHWENAKLVMARALALIGSLNAAAQTFSYTKTIPFVIVSKALKDYAKRSSESNLHTFLSMARVAHQLIKDNNMKTVDEDFPKFVDSPRHRTASNVQGSDNVCIHTINVFLTKLMFMSNKPPLTRAFFTACIEEIVRRKMGNPKYADNRPKARKIAAMHNYMKYVHIPEINTSDAEAPFQKAYNQFAGIDKKVDVKDTGPSEMATQSKEFKSQDHPLTPPMRDLVNEWEQLCADKLRRLQMLAQAYDFMREFDRLRTAFRMLDANLGIITTEIIELFKPVEFKLSDKPKFTDFITGDPDSVNRHAYHMILQNDKHTEHLRRINAVEEKTYVDPFGPDSHIIVHGIVQREIRSAISRENTRITQVRNGVFTEVFGTTNSIEVAVGVLLMHCKNVGDSSFWQLIARLSDSDRDTPFHLEKVRLLVEWKHGEKIIYRTRPGNDEQMHYRWPATYSKATRLMRANRAIRQRQNLAVQAKYDSLEKSAPIVEGDAENPMQGFRSDPTKIQKILTKKEWFAHIFRYVSTRDGKIEVRTGPPNMKRARRGKRKA